MTTYLKNKVLNSNLREVTVGLFNGETEVTAESYARQASIFTAADNGQTSNDKEILFPVATTSWGNITHVGIFDSADNLIFKSLADYGKTIEVSSQYKIPKNYLIIRIM